MGKIISLSSCKGGISKTTSTINIGVALAMLGHKVLVLDNDPQSSLTTYLGLKEKVNISLPNLMKAAMEGVSEDELSRIVSESILSTKHLDVIPSHIKMSGLEMGISMATNREYILSDILSCIKDKYDFILIDNLPALGIFTINALTASDSVIIPVETHFGALEGFDQILATIKMIKKRLNPALQIEGVLLAKHQERTRFCRSVRDIILEEYGEKLKIFQPPIPYSIKVAETSSLGVSIFEHDPKNPAAEAYMSIAKEVSENGR
jgi:chromosome partitioning protein